MKNAINFILLSFFFSLTLNAQDVNSIIQQGAKIENIASGYSFTEGPAVNKNGQIYFTDQPNNKIFIWDENQGISEFVLDGERSNGLYFDAEGQLLACADYRNKLIKISMDGNKTVLLDNYDNKHLNGPNDLWVHPNGNIYFTDSYYERPWWPEGQIQAQDCRGVYCLKSTGEIIRVIDDYKMPNGIIGTPDGKTLYVADINDQKTWKYKINNDGTLSEKTFFAPEGSDGMTIDNVGNIYLTNSAVSIFAPDGQKLGQLEIPEIPANICFGGKDRNILFITARTSIYTIKTKVIGVN